MKVIIVAEQASMTGGGEAILPMHYFRLLRARGVDAFLVAHSRTRPELQDVLRADVDRLHFVPDTWIHRSLARLAVWLPARIGAVTAGQIAHLYSQYLERRLVKKLVKEHGRCVVHQPTPVSPKAPSLLFNVGAPVVIGPLNGGMTYPPAFSDMQGTSERLVMGVGRSVAGLVNRILPGKLRASIILVANERTRRALPKNTQGRVVELVENGVDLHTWSNERLELSRATSPGSVVRFVFVGRLVDWKAVDQLLEAFQRVAKESNSVLEVIGDGPMRSTWEQQAVALGIEKRVKFLGWMSQLACAAHLKSVDVLVLPSLYECGGAVVLEAMALEMPVIATDWGGPADYLDSSCGILIAPTSRSEFVASISRAMLTLAGDASLRTKMGKAGRRRVESHFSWEGKVDSILNIYKLALEERATTAVPQS
jgi:glycosyltransferase involved in cell wall biosynthesis